MLKNYLKTAWRHLIKNKAHSLINIGGLSIGLACSLLLFLWIQHEMATDAFHAKGDRLYKVYEREYYSNHIDGNYDTPGLLAEELKKNMPEVEDAMMLQEENDHNALQAGDKILKVEGAAAGASIFNMFSYPLLTGNAQTALGTVNSMAISRKTANQFFGGVQQAMGKTIRFSNRKDFMVTAVFEDLPATASRRFDYLISWDSWLTEHTWARRWDNSGPLTFVLLRKEADAALVDKKMAHFLDNYNKDQSAAYRIEIGLQKFSEVYLHSQFKEGKVSGGRIEYIYLFGIVAVFILAIACINFMNLTTARSVKRAKEVGVRKSIGALRSVLMIQFISESLLLTAVSVVIALLLMTLLLPFFNQLTGLQMELRLVAPSFWLKLGALTVITGLLAGLYPALYLSAFNPAKVLKGAIKHTIGAIWFRKGLVIFQFVLSIILITGTIIVSRQIDFIRHRNLGYDRDNLVYIPIEGELAKKYQLFKDELLKMPGIQSVSEVTDNPSNMDAQTNGVDWEGRDPGTMISFEQPVVGYDFVHTMRLQLAEGRDFSPAYSTDKDGFIINETAARQIGYTPAVGRWLVKNGHKGYIVGVLKDFHFRSLHEGINPLIMELRAADVTYGNILIRIQSGKTKEAMAGIESLCKTLNPAFPFSYSFSDEEYQKLYQSEQVAGRLSTGFAILAILISCMGLLGLVMFTAEQRTKEIGIRKVLGASIAGLLRLLTADFLKLVVIAILIATPIAWWAMTSWLNNYAYKTTINWWIFVLAGGLAVVIALGTISFHAFKAALANPVNSLKNE
jgi:putative ABC transport system permease protein